VPLDLFPTDVIASSLVQKTYSANYPGEFGGGVINLTTLAIPRTPFLNVSVGVSGDSFTTNRLGYDYYGSSSDWTGYDDGARSNPEALKTFVASRERLSTGRFDGTLLAREFVNADNAVIQEIPQVAANYSAAITGGTSWMFGENQLGLIATAGTSNKWRTRENTQQTAGNADLSLLDRDYRNVVTENRIVNNALVGLSYEFGDHRVRWTNLYIRDTLKRASLAEGVQNNQRPGQDFREQYSAWYERQILNTQVNGSLKFAPLAIDFRAAYAKSSRDAPYELDIGYVRTNQTANPFGQYFINRLDNGQTGYARVSFGELDEELKSGGIDLTREILPQTILSAGIDYTETARDSTRREFQLIAPSTFPNAVAMFRPDYLLQPSVVDAFDIGAIESTETDPAFAASLVTKAGYVQVNSEIFAGFELSGGVRYEQGLQRVRPVQVFTVLTNSGASTRLDNDYFLPAVTATWKFAPGMQFRLNGSKTIARPQFRELMFQAYFDPETNRFFRGNPLLVDSEFTNAEGRFEWYFTQEERLSVAGFYKQIDKPIEAFTSFNDNSPETSFVNAPKATLYGVEFEVQKFLSLDSLTDIGFLADRRLVGVANYTFTQSQLDIRSSDSVPLFGAAAQPATNFFVDGVALSGQSDHLVNLQIGVEHPGRLSQQTLLLSFASDRVTSRGAAGLPDIYESPGPRLDFVAREGFSLFGQPLELKFEARNLTQRDYREFQRRGGNRVFYNRYDIGTGVSLSLTANF
jgi:hypothetical protein